HVLGEHGGLGGDLPVPERQHAAAGAVADLSAGPVCLLYDMSRRAGAGQASAAAFDAVLSDDRLGRRPRWSLGGLDRAAHLSDVLGIPCRAGRLLSVDADRLATRWLHAADPVRLAGHRLGGPLRLFWDACRRAGHSRLAVARAELRATGHAQLLRSPARA